MSLWTQIDKHIRKVIAELVPKTLYRGTIVSASTTRVLVSGIGDQPVACDWSPAFAAEVAASTTVSLAGRKVLVHMVDGKQPVISHSIIVGEK